VSQPCGSTDGHQGRERNYSLVSCYTDVISDHPRDIWNRPIVYHTSIGIHAVILFKDTSSMLQNNLTLPRKTILPFDTFIHTRSRHYHPKLSLWHRPLLLVHIPNTNIISRKVEIHFLSLPWLKVDSRKVAEDSRWFSRRGRVG
jgi:hypothetical protein